MSGQLYFDLEQQLFPFMYEATMSELMTYDEMLAEYIRSMKSSGKDVETIERECRLELDADIAEGIAKVRDR